MFLNKTHIKQKTQNKKNNRNKFMKTLLTKNIKKFKQQFQTRYVNI